MILILMVNMSSTLYSLKMLYWLSLSMLTIFEFVKRHLVDSHNLSTAAVHALNDIDASLCTTLFASD